MEFSVDDYYPPEWSALPSHQYYFEIIKEGNLLGKIPVKNKQFNLIGRLEDLCDIHIDNPLVSRKHAIIQAKKDDHFLYLMDLGSQHGTFVNRVKLPPKTYKRLDPFDSLKFGVSSRVYILRCPEYERLLESQENQRQNQFTKLLEEQHRKVSKEQMKAKYLDMLQNDPYFAANQGPRQLKGQQQEEEDEYAGIDWGITDERAVYAYRNDSDLPIEPDLLRRLNLEVNQLTKLSQYEEHLRRYQEIQAELNELTTKEKRQYGLEEKLRNKKEKLQKKFMEALQAVQKCEDWLRNSIFGEVAERNKKNAQTIRQKQNDTFEDDVFLDRTLQKKEVEPTNKQEVPQAETYWLLEAKLKSSTQDYQQLKQRLRSIIDEQGQPENAAEVAEVAQEDELDAFMRQNKIDTDNSNIGVLQRQMTLLEATIAQIKDKLSAIVGETQVAKIIEGFTTNTKKTLQQEFLQKSMEETIQISKKKMNENKNIEDILDKIENYQKNEEELDQNNVDIFKYYKEAAISKDQPYDLDEQEALARLRAKRQHYDPTAFEKPANKLRIVNDRNPTRVQPQVQNKAQEFEEDDAIDLTKQFK